MSERLSHTPPKLMIIPSPEELYEFGVQLNQLIAAQEPGGDVDQKCGELNEDYEIASADLVKKQAEITEKKALVVQIEKEIAATIESMSNDDAMIPASESASEELIQSRMAILYSRLLATKRQKTRYLSDIKLLEQEVMTIISYTDQNRNNEQQLVAQGPSLEQELGRLALVIEAVASLANSRPTLARYALRHKYAPVDGNNSIEGLFNIGNQPGEQYSTRSVVVPISIPVAMTVEPPPIPETLENSARVLPPVKISARTQTRYLQPVTKTNRR